MLGVTNPWILPELSSSATIWMPLPIEWIMDNECFIPHILLLFMDCPVANHISHNHLLSNFHKLVLVRCSIAHSTLVLIIIINGFLHRLVLLTLRWWNIAFFSPGGVNIACRFALPVKIASLTDGNFSAVSSVKLPERACIWPINSATVKRKYRSLNILSQISCIPASKQQEGALAQITLVSTRLSRVPCTSPPVPHYRTTSLQKKFSGNLCIMRRCAWNCFSGQYVSEIRRNEAGGGQRAMLIFEAGDGSCWFSLSGRGCSSWQMPSVCGLYMSPPCSYSISFSLFGEVK